MKLKIRFTKDSDFSNISKLGSNSYSDEYYEDDESFKSKIENCYEGCLVADVDGIVGYIISFPYIVGKSFPINSIYTPIKESNCWYIHDLCVSKDFRGKGIAADLAKNIILNKKIIALTAVQNSESFWKNFGFRSFFEIEYCGKKAKYMMLIT